MLIFFQQLLCLIKSQIKYTVDLWIKFPIPVLIPVDDSLQETAHAGQKVHRPCATSHLRPDIEWRSNEIKVPFEKRPSLLLVLNAGKGEVLKANVKVPFSFFP